ncbi:uncharacterized protein DEA37_0010992 [Paragonimus westermani]|uniref:Reverse transcriptase domain-containing protein n=1 Tax=Paragonimus westermani TaxID=34504 RepID=A0A5J4NQ37_9TREM|nr:uncharacterized protein DEA37_0010992 [Paragonimus westermani]
MTDDQFKTLIIVCGLQSPAKADIRTLILDKMEYEPKMTLQTIITEYQRLINLEHDAMMIRQSAKPPTSLTIQSIHAGHPHPGGSRPFNHYRPSKPSTPCLQCDGWQYVRSCPFHKHKCQKCNHRSHKEDHCRANKQLISQPRSMSSGRRFQNSARQSYSIFATFLVDYAYRLKYITLTLNGTTVWLQVDTASDITIILRSTWNPVCRPAVRPTTHNARNASGGALRLSGELACEISFGDFHLKGSCYLTEQPELDLLGLDWIDVMNLLETPISRWGNGDSIDVSPVVSLHTASPPGIIDHLYRKHTAVFQGGLGRCTKTNAVLHLLPNARPVFRPKRPVPYAALPLVDKELDRLQEAGVLKPVNYSTWAAPIVAVKKLNGAVRICDDFSTGLNASLDMHQHPLPLPDDLFAKMNGGKLFAKLELKDAYLQVEVAEASKELLTINTHRGLLQYQRLPFGVKAAPAVFQQITDTMLTDIPVAAAYLDDIVVTGVDEAELTERLDLVFGRIADYGFRIRQENRKKSIGQADALSRLIGSQTPDPEEALIAAVSFEAEVNQVFSEAIRTLPVTAELVVGAALRNQILQSVISHNQNRWPDGGLTGDLEQFFRRRSAILTLNGCVLFGERVVIPTELQPRVIRQLHVGHPGILLVASFSGIVQKQHGHKPDHIQKVCDQSGDQLKSGPNGEPNGTAVRIANKKGFVIKRAFSPNKQACLSNASRSLYKTIALKKNLIATERVQRVFTKMVNGLRHLSYKSRYETLGLFPLEFQRLRGELIFTFSLAQAFCSNSSLQ